MSDPEAFQDDQAHERRVQRILKQARRETGLRDLLTFCGARVWIAILALGAAAYVAIANRIEPQMRQD